MLEETNNSSSFVVESDDNKVACIDEANQATICKLLMGYICMVEGHAKYYATSEINGCTNCQVVRKICSTSTNYCYGSSKQIYLI